MNGDSDGTSSTIRVTVHDRSRRTPTECAVFVGEHEVESVGGGMWIGESNGMTTVGATCQGVPAVPQYVKAEAAERVVLQWLGHGPTLLLPKAFKTSDALYLQSDTPKGGWRVKVERSEAGTYQLPPLPVGDYRLSLGAASLLKRMNMGDPAETDVVLWTEQPDGYLGSLRVTRNMLKGPISNRRMEAQ